MAQKTAGRRELNQYYGIGVVMAVGVIGGLGYYIYGTKRGEVHHTLIITSLRWIKSLLYYKNGQEEYSK